MLSDLFSTIRLTCVITTSRVRDAITCLTVTEHFVITERAPAVITSVYWIIKAEREGLEMGWGMQTEIFLQRLKSWKTFLGSSIITYTHLPETVDRKYALSAEITTFFFSFFPQFAYRLPSSCYHPLPPDSLTKDKSSPVRNINKSDKPTRVKTTYFASYFSLAQDAVTGVVFAGFFFVFLCLLLASYSCAGDNSSLVCKPSFSKRANGGWIMSPNMLINLGFIWR